MSENTGGRPTKYDEKYDDEMYKWFDREAWSVKKVVKMVKMKPVEITIKEPCKFPTFERYALNVGVHVDTLREWRDVNEGFSEAYKKCKAIQKDILIQNGLFGHYEKAYTIFLSKNVTDMRNDPIPEVEQGDLEWIE